MEYDDSTPTTDDEEIYNGHAIPAVDYEEIYNTFARPPTNSNTFTWKPPAYCRGTYNFTEWWDPPSEYIPENVVYAGTDRDGDILYAVRALHEEEMIPAKLVPMDNLAYFSVEGIEHAVSSYEYLQSTHVAWRPVINREVPPEAIPFGKTTEGEFMFMGRVVHDGTLAPGKVLPSHGYLYITYDGMEIMFEEYEVLILL